MAAGLKAAVSTPKRLVRGAELAGKLVDDPEELGKIALEGRGHRFDGPDPVHDLCAVGDGRLQVVVEKSHRAASRSADRRYRRFVGLDVYRSCSWQEKREVLGAFWHTGVHPSERINEAALEYGPYAVLCIVVIVLELVPVILYSIVRGDAWGWLAGLLELGVIASLRWALVRSRTLKSRFAAPRQGATPAPGGGVA